MILFRSSGLKLDTRAARMQRSGSPKVNRPYVCSVALFALDLRVRFARVVKKIAPINTIWFASLFIEPPKRRPVQLTIAAITAIDRL